MLRLSHEQLDAIQGLLARRHAQAVAGVLADAWPAVVQRLRERWPAFVEAALQQAGRLGIAAVPDLARFASLWCIWGASFADKPGFEWARDIVADPRRTPALKVHQLLHHTRAELARQPAPAPGAAPVVSVAQFDAALAALQQRTASLAAARGLFLDEPAAPPIVACDIATLDLLVAEGEIPEYRLTAGVWQRAGAPKLGLPALQWTRAPDEPAEFAVPSHPLRGGPAARLNLRVTPQAVCDPRVHPEVLHVSPQGRLAWKGRDAARLSLALYASPPEPPDPKLGPDGIAARAAPELHRVEVASCGLRDAGAPFGAVSIGIRVVPAVQWKLEVRHGGFPALAWPNPPVGEAPGATGCQLEADGRPVDAVPWQRDWAQLPGRFRAGLEKLFNAWARQVENARLEVEAAPLVGQAALTWGWRRTAADAVAMRTEGRIDLLACSLDLRLSGELVHEGARARIVLACKGRSELRLDVAQLGDAAEEGHGLAAVKRSWRFPFTLEVEPLAGGGTTVLQARPLPAELLGALSGECGLRPRPDGKGQQWYFRLGLEPAQLALAAADPLLGTTHLQRELLPAQPLVDWSAG